MKYSNSEGYTDFADGLIPDRSNLLDDDLIVDNAFYNNKLIYSYPLGNSSDPMTRRAIELMPDELLLRCQTRSAYAPVAKFTRLPDNNAMERRRNLFVPYPSTRDNR
jgi:hypothetical protein